MAHTWLSVIPFVLVISMSIWLKNLLPGLVSGLITGSLLVKNDLLSGIDQTVSYLVTTLSNHSNIKIIGFLYLFGGLVGMMNISGGIKGFSEWVGSRIRTERGLLGLIWLTLPFTFMMPMFRIMLIGPVVKSIIQKIKVPKEKVGLMLDISTESVIVLLPVATAFVGFMVSLVEGSIRKLQLDISAYHVFILSIFYNFFAIGMLIIGIFRTVWNPSRKSNRSKINREQPLETAENDLHRASIKKELSMVKAQPWNLIFPVCLLMGLTLFLMWQNGTDKGARSLFDAFSKADATFVMLSAVFISLVFTLVFYLSTQQKLSEILYHFYDGGNQMMEPISLLVLIWSLTLAAEDLGFSSFIGSTLGAFIPAFLTPVTIFLLACMIGYFIGSSWGTWGLFMPLGMSLAVATGAPVPLTVGAVFAGGTFGALTSPLGDTTITTAAILDLPLVQYSRYKLKISVLGAAISCAFYLISALLMVQK